MTTCSRDNALFAASGPMVLAWLYFFGNSLWLPEGLLYTTLLTPWFVLWLYRHHAMRPLFVFAALTLPFLPLHLHQGVDFAHYLISYALLGSAVIFAVLLHQWLQKGKGLEQIFSSLLTGNALLTAIALAALAFPAARHVLWYLKEISPGVGSVPRLRLFTYEASYYALLLVPLALYYGLRLWSGPQRGDRRAACLILGPLLLSFSLGVIGGLALTALILLAADRGLYRLGRRPGRKLLLLTLTVGAGVALLYAFDPGNPLFGRLDNLWHGEDTSFRGRTYEAFILASRIAAEKSLWFGCGPGQAKLLGVDVFRHFYGYLPPVVRIPNAVADTLASYGLLGLGLRLGGALYLFFKTRVYGNYYRLSVFTFIFLYQFTGSFSTNIVEFVLWVLAFSPVFPAFDRRPGREGVAYSLPARSLRIAFLGSRGVPNRYGGFEQFVSHIAPLLAARGHRVWVYNPSSHPYREKSWKGVHIVRCSDQGLLMPESRQMLYDLRCILDLRRRKPDVVFQLGYTSSSLWGGLIPRSSLLVTHMDGIEWSRDKYGPLAQVYLRQAERWALRQSDLLVADARAIGQYLQERHGAPSVFIPYGACIPAPAPPEAPARLGLQPYGYDLVICRCVPENQLEMLLQGHVLGGRRRPLLVIGMDEGRYARRLRRRYSGPKLILRERLYDTAVLNNLRHYCRLYFHGHSAGGTNPSLLEALACRCIVAAHSNPFNREVLGRQAYYFESAKQVARLMEMAIVREEHRDWVKANLEKIRRLYSWPQVLDRIERLVLGRHGESGAGGDVSRPGFNRPGRPYRPYSPPGSA